MRPPLDAGPRRVQRPNVDALPFRRRVGLAAATVLISTLTASSLALARAPTPTAEHVGDPPGEASCFLLRQWNGRWKITPDSRTMYIGAAGRVYRLDLITAYPLLKSAWAVVSYRDSSDTICRPIDLRLVVTDQLGSFERILVKRMTLLTPDEAAALPKSLRPSNLYPPTSSRGGPSSAVGSEASITRDG
jgi:hypothetical protein